MRYLLDTDSVSYALRGEGQVGNRIRERKPSELAISAITVAELRYGADRKGSRKLHTLIDTFVTAVEVALFDELLDVRKPAARGHVPVDGPDVVARLVFAHLGKLQTAPVKCRVILAS